MTPAAPTAYWRKVCEQNFSRLIEDLEQQVETEVKSRVSAVLRRSEADALPESRRALAEELNQAVRRLRQTANLDDLYSVLLDVTVPFCDQAALFSVHEKRVRAERIRRHAGAPAGESSIRGERLPRLEIPTSQAAAFATAIDTRDPVIAMSAPGEVSDALVGLFGHKRDDRIYLFPMVVNEAVAGILYATGRVQGQLLELLAGVAAAKPMNNGQHNEWTALSRREQHLHLAAQRFARVQVAEMRISKLDVLRSASETRDIYGALKSPID